MNSASDSNEELSQINDQHSSPNDVFQFAENEEFLTGSPSMDDRKSCTCKDCGKVFNSVWYLKQHAVKHSSERPFKCKYCHKTYRFRSNLYQHKCPSRDRAYEMNGSRKSSSSQRSPMKNKVTTTPMPSSLLSSPLALDGKKLSINSIESSTTSSLSTNGGDHHHHNNNHNHPTNWGEFVTNNSSSSPSTPRKFVGSPSPTNEEVQQFIDRHKDTLHKCAQCKILFPNREYLTRHMSWHDIEESKVKCTFCSELFDNEQQYGLHKQMHVPHSSYACQKCRGKFCHRLALKKHLAKCQMGNSYPTTPTPNNGIYNPAMFIDRTPPSTPFSESSPESNRENNFNDSHHSLSTVVSHHNSSTAAIGDVVNINKNNNSDSNYSSVSPLTSNPPYSLSVYSAESANIKRNNNKMELPSSYNQRRVDGGGFNLSGGSLAQQMSFFIPPSYMDSDASTNGVAGRSWSPESCPEEQDNYFDNQQENFHRANSGVAVVSANIDYLRLRMENTKDMSRRYETFFPGNANNWARTLRADTPSMFIPSAVSPCSATLTDSYNLYNCNYNNSTQNYAAETITIKNHNNNNNYYYHDNNNNNYENDKFLDESNETLTSDELEMINSPKKSTSGNVGAFGKGQTFQCDGCGCFFFSKKGLHNHMLKRHVFAENRPPNDAETPSPKKLPKLLFSCAVCSASYESESILAAHTVAAHEVDTKPALSAISATSANSALRRSTRRRIVKLVHSPSTYQPAAKSAVSAKSATSAAYRVAFLVPEKALATKKRDKKWSAGVKKSLRCTYCPKTFHNQRYVKKHEKLQHETPEERRGQGSSLVYNLKHKETYKLKCPICIKRFCSPRLLKQHLAFHNRANKIDV